ncbi:MAG: OmpH family outer membrane protein, partial [Pyrinomonadaceae bacterium]|nr:OmpH family outer membrane protein [Pyrinomonadaceae bacterium]
MKTFRTFTLAALFVAVLALAPVSAQQAARPAAQTPRPAATAPPATSSSGASSTNAIGIVNTAAFGDPKTGITRLVNALNGVNREFQPRNAELQTLRKNIQDATTALQNKQQLQDAAANAREQQRIEQMQVEFTRKGEDAQRAYDRRLGEVVAPIETDINTALTAFARQRNLSMVFNVSQLPNVVLVLNDSMDLT